MSPLVCGDRLPWRSGLDSVCARRSGHPGMHLSSDLISWGVGQWDPVPPWVLAEVQAPVVGEVAA